MATAVVMLAARSELIRVSRGNRTCSYPRMPQVRPSTAWVLRSSSSTLALKGVVAWAADATRPFAPRRGAGDVRPISANFQLLCGLCNRTKGASLTSGQIQARGPDAQPGI